MSSPRLPLFIGTYFIALIAIVHLARYLWPFQIIIGSYHVPTSISAFACFVLGYLAIWMYKAIGKIS